MQVTLDVKENQWEAFINFINVLDFVNIKDLNLDDTESNNIVREDGSNYGLEPITLQVQKSKLDAFIRFMESLDFVQLIDSSTEITEWAKKIVRERKASEETLLNEKAFFDKLENKQ